jgi:hypothetical protein
MSTGAGDAANETGAPALGCPLVWVCGYRCGTLTCGWMSTTHAWWPKSVGMLISQASGAARGVPMSGSPGRHPPQSLVPHAEIGPDRLDPALCHA